MKPIRTKYKGCLFRSRLEARWAVFFDALGLAWEYEREGFQLQNGDWYLPDFHLPEQQLWLEIKGNQPTQEDLLKIFYLQAELWEGWERGEQYAVFILLGDIPHPYPKAANAISSICDYLPVGSRPEYCWQQCPMCLKIDVALFSSEFCRSCLTKAYDSLEMWINGTLEGPDFELLPKLIDWNYFVKLGGNVNDLRAIPEFEKDFVLTPNLVDKQFFTTGHKSRKLQEAYAAAKSAWFEHGHSGRTL